MKLSKVKMFTMLNGLIALSLVIYFSLWVSGEKTIARVVPPYASSTVTAIYQVKGKIYKRSYLRNNVSFKDEYITITYLSIRPSSSRIYSFWGIAAEPLAWWFVFLLASAMLFFTDNIVFSKNTIFKINRKFPWISMEEYFQLPWYYRESASGSPGGSPPKNFKKRLKGH